MMLLLDFAVASTTLEAEPPLPPPKKTKQTTKKNHTRKNTATGPITILTESNLSVNKYTVAYLLQHLLYSISIKCATQNLGPNELRPTTCEISAISLPTNYELE